MVDEGNLNYDPNLAVDGMTLTEAKKLTKKELNAFLEKHWETIQVGETGDAKEYMNHVFENAKEEAKA